MNKTMWVGLAVAAVSMLPTLAFAGGDFLAPTIILVPINSVNQSAFLIHTIPAQCTDGDQITLTVSGKDSSGNPLTLVPFTTTCTSGAWSMTIDVHSLADGALDFAFTSSDGSHDDMPNVPKDTVPPSLTAVDVGGTTTLASGYTFPTNSLSFDLTFADDNENSVTCQIDSFAAENCASFSYATTTPLANGSHTLTINATDQVDNPMTPVVVHFTVGSAADTMPPVITAPADQSFATTTFPASPTLVQATATDNSGVAPTITYAPQTFSAGTTTVTWTATDGSGNSATTTSQVGVFLNVDATVDVPANCSATDDSAVAHTYEATSSTSYLAICAVEAALASSTLSSAALSNEFPSVGLFLTTIDGVEASSTSQYWAFYHNGTLASFGLTQEGVALGDTLLLQLHDFADDNLGSQVTLHINSLIATSTAPSTPSGGGGGGGGSGGISHGTFNLPAALSYLADKQKTDGSFDDTSLYTDWGAIALAAGNSASPLTLIKQYETNVQPILSSAADYERHAMALEALGINPYSGTSVNYIAPILADFDGTQIGSSSEDNDDIFGVIALTHAGYSASDAIIQKETAFLISKQLPDGSWDESPDLTAAAIEALGPLLTDPQTAGQVLGGAAGFLQSVQQTSGGWSATNHASDPFSVDSTSWVQTAINGIIAAQTPGLSTEANWASASGFYPTDALASAQQFDGAVQPTTVAVDTRIWSTSYAVVAASGKDWDSVLENFSQPAATNGGSGGGVGSIATSTVSTSTATSTAATSTPVAATTTLALATTTPTPTVVATPESHGLSRGIIAPNVPIAFASPSHSQPSVTAPDATAPSSTTNLSPTSSAQLAAAASASPWRAWMLAAAVIALVLLFGTIGFFRWLGRWHR